MLVNKYEHNICSDVGQFVSVSQTDHRERILEIFPQISYMVPSLESFLKSSTKYSKTETTCVADNSLLQ